MNRDTVHKSKGQTGSVCGAYGYTKYLWRDVTCERCLRKRP